MVGGPGGSALGLLVLLEGGAGFRLLPFLGVSVVVGNRYWVLGLA